MDLIAALKRVFYTSSSAAAGVGTRIPLLNDKGEAVGSDTYENVKTAMNLNTNRGISKQGAGLLVKIMETSALGTCIFDISAVRYSNSDVYGTVKVALGRLSAGGRKVNILSASNIDNNNFKMYYKNVNGTIIYYAYIAATYGMLSFSVHTAWSNIYSTVRCEQSDEDISTLTEIPLTE